MSGDAYRQVTPDSTGKKVGTQEVTRPSGDVVERQEIVLADRADVGADALARVAGSALQIDDKRADEILAELRRIRIGLGFLINQDLSNF